MDRLKSGVVLLAPSEQFRCWELVTHSEYHVITIVTIVMTIKWRRVTMAMKEILRLFGREPWRNQLLVGKGEGNGADWDLGCDFMRDISMGFITKPLGY